MPSCSDYFGKWGGDAGWALQGGHRGGLAALIYATLKLKAGLLVKTIWLWVPYLGAVAERMPEGIWS